MYVLNVCVCRCLFVRLRSPIVAVCKLENSFSAQEAEHSGQEGPRVWPQCDMKAWKPPEECWYKSVMKKAEESGVWCAWVMAVAKCPPA